MDRPCLFIFLYGSILGHPCFFWENSEYVDGFCYKLSNSTGKWSESKESCEAQNGQLLDPTDDKVNNLLFNMLMVTPEACDWWIGVSYVTPSVSSSSSGDMYQKTTLCPYVSASNRTFELPSVKNKSCEENNRFICEKFVGNPCVHLNMSDGEIYKDFCYHIHQHRMSWDKAKEYCNSMAAFLTEFREPEPYDYFKKRLREIVENPTATRTNEWLCVDGTVTFPPEDGYITQLYVVSCGGRKVYFYNPADAGEDKNHVCRHKWDQNHEIDLSANTAQNVANCRQPVLVQVYENFNVKVNSTLTTNSMNLKATPETKMAVYTAHTTGLWYLQKLTTGAIVFLGAMKSKPSTIVTDVKWLSNNETVSFNDWNPGEPSMDSEPYLTLGLNINADRTVGLNDFGGEAWPFCFKSAIKFTYIVVLPRRMADNAVLQLVVMSGDDEMAYLFLTQMVDTSRTLTQKQGWASSNRNESFTISGHIQSNNGIARSLSVLKATHNVTVAVERRQDQEDLPVVIVTFPKTISGRHFRVSVNESCVIDYASVYLSMSLVSSTILQ